MGNSVRCVTAVLCFAPAVALAQLFAEVGIGPQIGGCIQRHPAPERSDGKPWPLECTRGPMGVIAIGWQAPGTGLRLQWEHLSAPFDSRDRGVEFVTFRYRIEWK